MVCLGKVRAAANVSMHGCNWNLAQLEELVVPTMKAPLGRAYIAGFDSDSLEASEPLPRVRLGKPDQASDEVRALVVAVAAHNDMAEI